MKIDISKIKTLPKVIKSIAISLFLFNVIWLMLGPLPDFRTMLMALYLIFTCGIIVMNILILEGNG